MPECTKAHSQQSIISIFSGATPGPPLSGEGREGGTGAKDGIGQGEGETGRERVGGKERKEEGKGRVQEGGAPPYTTLLLHHCSCFFFLH